LEVTKVNNVNANVNEKLPLALSYLCRLFAGNVQ